MTDPDQPARSIPLVEETLSVDTRLVETGTVRVRTRVEERIETARADLARDEVTVEHVPIGRVVDVAPAPRQEGDSWIVPIVEEVLIVEKRLMLREEVRVTRRRAVEPFEQSVVLRATHAVVERDAPDQPAPQTEEYTS